MIIFECDGCGKQERRADGRKPDGWFERSWAEKKMELHVCSRECIKTAADKIGGHTLVLPI